MHKEYLIVGFGLAGLSFAEHLRLNDNSFDVVNHEIFSSSQVAGGMYNPVILKRFTIPWNAEQQMNYSLPFFKGIENFLQEQYLNPFKVNRVFDSVEEQNNWLIASDKTVLSSYMSNRFISNENPSLVANNKLGTVEHAGRLLVSKLLESYKQFLFDIKSYYKSSFNFDSLTFFNDYVEYNSKRYKHIVFAEGYGLKTNPFFNYLPLNGTKGEVLIIESEQLNVSSIIKSGVFIIPMQENNKYLVGATYNWDDKTWNPTMAGKEELILKLNKLITCPYKIVNQLAGIRPTVKDRRPLIGQHPIYKRLYVLNGLGTRGVMVGPLVSKQLYDFIEHKSKLPREIDISRFAELL